MHGSAPGSSGAQPGAVVRPAACGASCAPGRRCDNRRCYTTPAAILRVAVPGTPPSSTATALREIRWSLCHGAVSVRFCWDLLCLWLGHSFQCHAAYLPHAGLTTKYINYFYLRTAASGWGHGNALSVKCNAKESIGPCIRMLESYKEDSHLPLPTAIQCKIAGRLARSCRYSFLVGIRCV